jgi:hypothetical protein
MPYIILEISIQLRDLLVITKFTNYSLLIGYCPAAPTPLSRPSVALEVYI